MPQEAELEPTSCVQFVGRRTLISAHRGPRGTVYMTAIRPFRHLIVYPLMMRKIGRDWRARAADPIATPAD